MRTFRRETGLYLLALLLGLAVRLIALGALPLSDPEAAWALQALNIVRGTRIAIGSQPAYVVLTSALFFVFGGATNALARLIPALTGSGLILVPALFKEQLKPRAAVILSFALALEPGLASLSRQAGSAIMAVTFTLAAWGLWGRRRFSLAGVCAGMALLSGPALWPGLLGLGLTWALLRPFERQAPARTKRAGETVVHRSEWIIAASYALGTIVLLGTMFVTIPGGISAWIAGLPEYVSGWTRASNISIGVMLASLVAYQPVAILLGLMAIIGGWMRRGLRVRRLSLWMLVALLLALFYPSRQVTDLAWMLIPLWALASLEVARRLNVAPGERREVLAAAALVCVIMVFIWLGFLATRRPGIPQDQMILRYVLLLGSFFLLAISLVLVAAGWSIRIARFGAVWGLAAFLGVYSLGALMAAAGDRNVPDAAEMWRPGAQVPRAGLLLRTVQDQSQWSDLDINAQPVVIAGIDSPAMQWLFRDRQVEVRASPGVESNPPIVITRDELDPALGTGYRGQALVWRRTPLWDALDFAAWLPFHVPDWDNETVILWVRNDLFPDARPKTTP